MKFNLTKEKFQKYAENPITDEIAEDIEQKLKQFFSLLIKWAENEDTNGLSP